MISNIIVVALVVEFGLLCIHYERKAEKERNRADRRLSYFKTLAENADIVFYKYVNLVINIDTVMQACKAEMLKNKLLKDAVARDVTERRKKLLALEKEYHEKIDGQEYIISELRKRLDKVTGQRDANAKDQNKITMQLATLQKRLLIHYSGNVVLMKIVDYLIDLNVDLVHQKVPDRYKNLEPINAILIMGNRRIDKYDVLTVLDAREDDPGVTISFKG